MADNFATDKELTLNPPFQKASIFFGHPSRS